MFKDNKSDFQNKELNYAMISLLADKIKVGVIGFGNAGSIKVAHFLKLGCNVEVITKDDVIDDLLTYDNLTIIKEEYNFDFIKDKHIVIIAINDDEIRMNIINQCNELAKIYIDCTDFANGMAVLPIQDETKDIVLGINTKYGNPKGSSFVANKIRKSLNEYDGYIEYTSMIRNKVKKHPDLKKQVLDFIFSEDFYFFFKQNKHKEVMDLFYGEVEDGDNNCN